MSLNHPTPPLTDDIAERAQRIIESTDQKRRMDAQLLEAQRAAENAAAAIQEAREVLAGLSFPFWSSVTLQEDGGE